MRSLSERTVLHRLASVLKDVPGPSDGGTQSATAAGYIGAARDFVVVRRLVAEALDALSYADAPPSAWEEPLAQAEAFVARRRSEGWGLVGAGRLDPLEPQPEDPDE